MVIGIAFSVSLFTTFMGPHQIDYGQSFIGSAKKIYYIAAALSFLGATVSAIRNRNTAVGRSAKEP